jgi:hypothetical protein
VRVGKELEGGGHSQSEETNQTFGWGTVEYREKTSVNTQFGRDSKRVYCEYESRALPLYHQALCMVMMTTF